jgi:hypothetical protein
MFLLVNLTARSQLRENTFLHLDKQTCLSGDTIYYKAYIMGDKWKGLSNISTNLYVDLFDSTYMYDQYMFPIFDGQSIGQVFIPKNMPGAIYYIRAYTNLEASTKYPEDLSMIPIVVINPKDTFRWVINYVPPVDRIKGNPLKDVFDTLSMSKEGYMQWQLIMRITVSLDAIIRLLNKRYFLK